MKSCRICGTANEDTNMFCTECGALFEENPSAFEEEAGSVGYIPPSLERHYPMKWHQFLMIVWFAGGILGIIRGLTILTGKIYSLYGTDSEIVYRFYPKLEQINSIYGFVCIALSIFQIIMCNRLNKFRKNGPRLMVIYFILSIISSFVYQIASNAAAGTTSSNFVSNLLLTAALIPYLIINIIYYRKRKDLFVN